MGADLYLESIWNPFMDDLQKRGLSARTRQLAEDDPIAAVNSAYDEFRSSGAYFRCAYNEFDIMWAMGASWGDVVGSKLDEDRTLPVERARELVEIIEARPLTKAVLARHYLKNVTTNGSEHPITGWLTMMCAEVGFDEPPPPDFEVFARAMWTRRDELLTLLRKSIALNEPLLCLI
jgi:hypothetical protein